VLEEVVAAIAAAGRVQAHDARPGRAGREPRQSGQLDAVADDDLEIRLRRRHTRR
jgi:hypothetical protein